MNPCKKISVATKLLLLLLVVSMIPLFLVTGGFYCLGKRKLTEQAIQLLNVQAKNVSSTVNNYITFKFKHAGKLFDTPQLIDILKRKEVPPHVISRLVSSFRSKLRVDPDFLSAFLLNTRGNVVLSTLPAVDANYSTRPFFLETMKGRNYVSPPCKDEGISCIYFGIPIKDKNEILGVAVLQANADEFWELIEHESERIGAGNVVILSNLDGVRIAHSLKKELIFQSWAPLKSETKEQVLKEKRYGGDMKDIASTDFPEVMDAITQGISTRYFQHRLAIGMASYHSVIRVMDNGWRILCSIPESTFLEPVHTVMSYMRIIIGVVVTMVVMLSILIGRLGTKRINTFAAISHEIIKGNFTKTIPFTGDDEIGQLGMSFNIMIESIKQRIEQLRYLNDVAIEIHSHIELEHLLQEIVNISKKIIHAEMGVLLLLDDNGETIKYFKVSMPNPIEPFSIKEQPKGNGILGVVMKKGVSIRLDNVMKEPHCLMLPLNHPLLNTLLGVPLKIGDKPVGGIFLANKNNHEMFTLEDEEILRNISCQASVAIENAKLYDETYQISITDGLTGLLNHMEFYRRLNETIEGSKRYNYSVSVLLIDIDHFKLFNDNYGHQVGDRVLKVIGEVIKTHIRAVDVCARYGGEEFVVVLREADLSQSLNLAEHIRSSIHAYPFKHNGTTTWLSVSIGIALFPCDAGNASELVKKADMALYDAKKAGRNRVCCYTAVHDA